MAQQVLIFVVSKKQFISILFSKKFGVAHQVPVFVMNNNNKNKQKKQFLRIFFNKKF